MNSKELASLINGRQYMQEISREEQLAAKSDGLVVIFGYSDDNIELRGAIHDEIGAYNGRTIYLYRGGVLEDSEREECERCKKRIIELQKKCIAIEAKWCASGYSWVIQPLPEHSIAYSPFDIMEDEDKFCRGIVIDVNDLPLVEA